MVFDGDAGMNDDFEALARAAFEGEAQDMLREFERCLLQLAPSDRPPTAGPAPDPAQQPAVVDAALRAVHTLKGSAGIFSMGALVRLAHQLETCLDALRTDAMPCTETVLALLLAGHDRLEALCGEPTPEDEALAAELGLRVDAHTAQAMATSAHPADQPANHTADHAADHAPHQPAGHPAQADAAKAPERTPMDAEAATTPMDAAATPPAPSWTPLPPTGVAAAPAAPRSRSADGPTVRVGAAQLDELIERIAVVSTSVAAVQAQAQRSQAPELLEAARQVQADMVQAREDALALRMVPMSEVFARFPRLVRELGQRLQRDVALLVHDGDAEIDRAIVEAIADPLTHLIRNSMDHGIEPPEERQRRGKPARGHIALSASRDAGYVVIELRDDGRGLDRARIRARAVERGLLAPDARLSDDDVLRLICLPGFSTAQAVTDISGRGVGMDVVKRHVETLHGELLIQSEPGQGTCFRIRVPMTLALLDAFGVQVHGVSYLIPMDAVVECVDTPVAAPATIPTPVPVLDGFSLRGDWLALVDLRSVLVPTRRTSGPALAPAPEGPKPGLPATRSRSSVVVVRVRGQRMGLRVDRLLGEQAVVIKSLGPVFAGARVFSGAAVLADGGVGPVLDVAALHDLLQAAA